MMSPESYGSREPYDVSRIIWFHPWSCHQLSVCSCLNIGPGARSQELHREDGPYPAAIKGALGGDGDLVVWSMWALNGFTEANGATLVVSKPRCVCRGCRRLCDIPDPYLAGKLRARAFQRGMGLQFCGVLGEIETDRS
eukprot:SAG22_NODE_487_length_9870_cov_13.118821_6_plen_139_part_00